MKKLNDLPIIMVFVGILISLAYFIPLVNAQEGQVILNPIDDAYVDSYTDSVPYGFVDEGSLQVSTYEGPAGTRKKLTWLKFALSDVPDGAVVDGATLELFSTTVTTTYNVSAHSCSNTFWMEWGLTYANMPEFNATPMYSTEILSGSERHNWDVLDAIRKAVNGMHGGSDVVTIVLVETSSRSPYSFVEFASKDMTSDKAPKLTVHWSDIIPEFPSFLILPLFMMAALLAVIVYRTNHFM